MPRHDLEVRFAESMQHSRLLAPDESVVVGVSGGPDSVALLHLICSLSGTPGWTLRPHVAHLNHRLRGAESEADASFVADLARSLKLPFTVDSVDVAMEAEAGGVSVEQAGRDARLAFMERVCLTTGSAAVALGHHGDDNAETVLHRIVRGTGFRGLVGIRPVRPLREGSHVRLVRPLLPFRRAELEAYLRDRSIAYRQDETNTSDAYTRNRIRNEVLPLLRQRLNPQVDDALIRLAEQAQGLDDFLTETAQRMLESIIISQDGSQVVLHSEGLARKARLVQTQVIREALLRLGVGEADLTYGHLNAVADLAAGQEGSRGIHLPGGVRASRRYARLVLERINEGSPKADTGAGDAAQPETRISVEGITPAPGFKLEFTADILTADERAISEHLRAQARRDRISFEEWMDADRVAAPLTARSRRPGDRFLPLGMTSQKKLSDFFIDEKIEAGQRDRTVVLWDQLGPVWVVPFRIDERVRLTPATRRILRLRVRELETDRT
jgi:tRNA(Ile)-lysidine synthase